jgi:5-methylcytosine-specific restriction protein A
MKRRLQGLNLTFVSLKVSHSHEEDFQKAVSASLSDRAGRKKRLTASSPKPTQRVLVQKVFVRNADVVAEVLERADGRCEQCGKPAPFLRAKDKRPYLEVHHKITLASGGDDTVANAVAVCPNCHREAHHG